jgi:tRNA G18 (ribose-2'-O)-methylase SpoU
MPIYRNIINNSASNLNVHDHLKDKTVDDLKALHEQDRLNYAICALNVTGDLNVSMMMRTASLLGVKDFYIFGRRIYDKRGTVGAQNYMNVHRIAGLKEDGVTIDAEKFAEFITSTGYYPVFIEQGGTDITEASIGGQWLVPPVFIFGNEGMGIPQEVIDATPTPREIISIPQRGVLRSFNVAAAASIVMWEFAS